MSERSRQLHPSAHLPRRRPGRPCTPLHIERECVPDRDAQLAALRVVLGLPRALPSLKEAA
jgi:hypothetical protein